ncbi:uncharacterized protein JCM15063_002933 [Sporobolomyces koalae]|uniref:uncharacterized protein n=1 Tax=Sporobolomyces koalae TaxID=500713 RepID=UPI00317694CF
MKRISTLLIPWGLISTVSAQLDTMRATIPGSLHQCEQTNLFLFDTMNLRPITMVLLPSSESEKARPANLTLTEALALNPLQMLSTISTLDAQSYAWQVQVDQNVTFETWGFLPDGRGKNLNLTRTVQPSLPGTTSCQVPVRQLVSKHGVETNKLMSSALTKGTSNRLLPAATSLASAALANTTNPVSSAESASSAASEEVQAPSSGVKLEVLGKRAYLGGIGVMVVAVLS